MVILWKFCGWLPYCRWFPIVDDFVLISLLMAAPCAPVRIHRYSTPNVFCVPRAMQCLSCAGHFVFLQSLHRPDGAIPFCELSPWDCRCFHTRNAHVFTIRFLECICFFLTGWDYTNDGHNLISNVVNHHRNKKNTKILPYAIGFWEKNKLANPLQKRGSPLNSTPFGFTTVNQWQVRNVCQQVSAQPLAELLMSETMRSWNPSPASIHRFMWNDRTFMFSTDVNLWLLAKPWHTNRVYSWTCCNTP